MRSLCARPVAICLLLLGAPGQVHAGGVHIRYGPHAPEKLAAANIRYYHGILHLESNHPIEFAHEHPFYAKLLHDPEKLDRLVARWQAHEQRFEYWHLCLWKVLDGYWASHHVLPVLHPLPGPEPPLDIGDLQITDQNGTPIGPANPGGGLGGGGGGGGGIHTAAVPEPSSVLMLGLGLVIAASGLAHRAARTHAAAARPSQG